MFLIKNIVNYSTIGNLIGEQLAIFPNIAGNLKSVPISTQVDYIYLKYF
jgi:hypothetical protein